MADSKEGSNIIASTDDDRPVNGEQNNEAEAMGGTPGNDHDAGDDDNDDDNDDADDNDDEDDGGSFVVQFEPLLAELKERMNEAGAHQPKLQDKIVPGVRKLFQEYWQAVMKDVENLIASNEAIPDQLTNPAAKTFRIWVFKQDEDSLNSCPCCLPICGDDIVLKNNQGVTKVDLIRGISQYLYADVDKFPALHCMDDGSTDALPVASVEFNYMTNGGQDETCVLASHEPGIWMYCTPP
ncbi:hypothetical protein EJ05DRAFT_229168 [Pseudovirgaria hyperparasitica]|uniref:Uncharacterized protein n=1 Tax=Pseudovirgaria hyperparasitica TaxID=470096 RepID=A0A6A6VTR9_9PEZI|nr:uncharacterized protein EJ05DRAFT_229168 [Pseudovirgaria hyperparasitica]KAF2753000.1 hypothetical protein EJ05DRAFT_229168 [Pseudovirgaria hyperparasitica]